MISNKSILKKFLELENLLERNGRNGVDVKIRNVSITFIIFLLCFPGTIEGREERRGIQPAGSSFIVALLLLFFVECG